MDNMLAALARHHGQEQAMVMLGEAFAGTFAFAAHSGPSSVAWRYALDVALANAFVRAASVRAAGGAV